METFSEWMGMQSNRCELEVWKVIPDYEGYYEASSLGRIRSLDRMTRTGFKAGRILVGKHLWDGYHSVLLTVRGKQRHFKTHALVLRAFIGPKPDGMEGRHLNGDKLDNRIANLRWGTAKENLDDKRRHGNVLSGERHPRYGKGVDKKEARRLEACGLARTAIAARLNCSISRVSQILSET